MLNFIVCEDNLEVRKINEQIINKSMFNNNIEYKIFSFSSYTEKLKNLIEQEIGKKIYILDIELDSKSGIEIAREIRKKDWASIIIMSTAHTELFPQVFKDRLLLFDFVSKFDNYNENLLNTIEKVLDIYELNKSLSFNIRKTKYKIIYDEILYFLYDKSDRKTIIKTIDNEFRVSHPMTQLSIDSPNYFVRINQHCIINTRKIKAINGLDKIIFVGNTILNEKIKNEKEVEKYVLD